MRAMWALGVLLILLAAPASSAAVPVPILEEVDAALADPDGYLEATLDQPLGGSDQGDGGAIEDEAPGFDESVRSAFEDEIMMVSALSAAAALVGVVGFALVSRYISPKEALRNPQRSMLYGFIRATPGAHLKQLSEEFGMKSSSILWHIRKLESADLVRSDRANGYRVFFPVEGGIELRRVSRAMTALQNENARRTYSFIQRRPGASAADMARSTGIHAGTVRWHLRKMREFGLIEELVSDQASKYFPTTLGARALESLEGRPVDGGETAQGTSSPLATPEGV